MLLRCILFIYSLTRFPLSNHVRRRIYNNNNNVQTEQESKLVYNNHCHIVIRPGFVRESGSLTSYTFDFVVVVLITKEFAGRCSCCLILLDE